MPNFNEAPPPCIASEAGKLHTQVYSLIGKVCREASEARQAPGHIPARRREAAMSRTDFLRFHREIVALHRRVLAPMLGQVRQVNSGRNPISDREFQRARLCNGASRRTTKGESDEI